MSGVLNEIITLLTAGISGMASGIGSGLQSLVSNIFLDTTGSTPVLSTFGGVIVIFGAVALAIGLSRFIVNWLTSWGN